ncbi:hypothetical protein OIV83_004321 [Microbotryomycetes sp. JL201]|nr:hypothetical protein OIV83_004305 [Microbotryomycetes sp. JL201]KAK4049174.1 hypothetical protein OIV83_004321 [Microbotryomycetes sp. JL201]
MSARPTLLTQTSAARRREPSFPSQQTRGSTTVSGAWASTTASNADVSSNSSPTGAAAARKKGPSLSLALSANEGDHAEIHPLKFTWDVWVSHRSANSKGNKKEEATAVGAKPGKEKETREEWEGAVVKLGGFSSIESMFPFLAHLTPPSALPSSVNSSSQLFGQDLSEGHAASNNVTDYNVFRSSIAPAWEDPANAGGGRWVTRLRKGVADRVWEESIFALVGERIGGEDDRIENKINGLVLSVRKDEDILSLWCAPTNRSERDAIRDAFRAALEQSLPAQTASNFVLDYKPHPGPNGTIAAPAARHDRERTESPHRSERPDRRSENGNGGRHLDRDRSETNQAMGVPPLSGFGGEGARRGVNFGDRSGSRGFSGYVREPRDRTDSATGSTGSGGSYGRPRRGSNARADGDAKSHSGWGRA